MTFGITFSINFPDRLNLVICNKYNAKTSFLHFRPLKLASKIDRTIMFFQSRFLDLLFLIFLKFIIRKWSILGPPFKIRWDPKWQPKLTKWRQNVENVRCGYAYFAVFFQTLFSRNHSNPCAVGTSWLLKGHLFDGDWLVSCFGCVSLCSVLYNLFYHLFS